MLWVVEGNDRAERVYRRLGFAHTGAAQPVPGNPSLTEVADGTAPTMTE